MVKKIINSQEIIRCGVPRESILRPLLYLIFVSDLQYATNMLNTTMFANYTSFLSSHSNIADLFEIANKETVMVNGVL